MFCLPMGKFYKMPASQFYVSHSAQILDMCNSQFLAWCFASSQTSYFSSHMRGSVLHWCALSELWRYWIFTGLVRRGIYRGGFKIAESTLSLITAVRVVWIWLPFMWRVWRTLCMAFKYLARQRYTLFSDSQKMSAVDFLNLYMFFYILFISGQKTALVE